MTVLSLWALVNGSRSDKHINRKHFSTPLPTYAFGGSILYLYKHHRKTLPQSDVVGVYWVRRSLYLGEYNTVYVACVKQQKNASVCQTEAYTNTKIAQAENNPKDKISCAKV